MRRPSSFFTESRLVLNIVTRLHRRLEESRVAGGVFFASQSPNIMEHVIHDNDMDIAGLDLQHAPISALDSVNFLRTMQAADPEITPFARLPNHDVYWIQQSLDAGYTGLVVPLVESADEARRLVRATYFPPLGARSTAGSIRAWMYEVDVEELNRRTLLFPQIESAEGLEHVEEILAVEGVSGVLFGPEDLSLSCGWRGKDLWSYSPFMEAVERVITACREQGKLSAILTGSYLDARRAGFQVIGYGGDCKMSYSTVTEYSITAMQQLRQLDDELSLKTSRSPGNSTGKADRIERYRHSLDKFDDWIEKHLSSKDGGWQQDTSADGFFSWLHYANFRGRRDWSARALRVTNEQFVSQDVPLKQGPNRDAMQAYVPLWLGWGAFEADAFTLSRRWLDYAATFQHDKSGGLFAGIPERDTGQGAFDFDSTTIAAVAFGRAGRVEPCRRVGQFLLNMMDLQPDLDSQLVTGWTHPGGLLTEPNDSQQFTILRWKEPGQFYYKAGLLVLALAHAYGATGDEKFLRSAQSLFHHTIESAEDLWTNSVSHKLCWAATTLHAITSNSQYVQHACRFADHLVDQQQADGAFHYPELWSSYPPEKWELIPNASSQFALWIARSLNALADVPG